MTIILIIAILLLAYLNGANDNFKGVATLFGSGTTSYRKALAWATVTTLAGSLLALLLAHQLLGTFQGRGLVPDSLTIEPYFLLAVGLGTALALALATVLGLPVSTTHALTGSLVGAGLMAAGTQLRLGALATLFVLPLLASPLLALLGTLVLYPIGRWGGRAFGFDRDSCICVGDVPAETQIQADGCLGLVTTEPQVGLGTMADCSQRFGTRMLGLEVGAVLDGCHFLSAGAVSFARGLNDTPKIVALLLAAGTIHPALALTTVGLFMAVGGWLSARRVADTMSRKITAMNPAQGFSANLVTSLLVLLASGLGMPVSTTHVSVGSLFGIGLVSGTARWRTILAIVLAWVTTLPLAAALAAGIYWLPGLAV